MQCAFCGSSNPVKSYPCTDFSSQGVEVRTGAWLACEPCSVLVDRDDYGALRKRSVDEMIAREPELEDIRTMMEQTLAAVHLQFRLNRSGDPYPHNPAKEARLYVSSRTKSKDHGEPTDRGPSGNDPTEGAADRAGEDPDSTQGDAP